MSKRHARHHFCSEACKRKQASQRYAAIARQRRAEARGPSRQCAVCGEPFEPARADARYCSPACKQKAYRVRVTLNETSVPDLPFAIRNARVGFASRNTSESHSAGRGAKNKRLSKTPNLREPICPRVVEKTRARTVRLS